MYNHAIPMFIGTFSGFVLLLLVTVSAPIVPLFYFLRTSADDGVKFGVWGYCARKCSTPTLGYAYGSEVTSSQSVALVLYPVAAGVSLCSMITLSPLVRYPKLRRYPHPLFCLLALAAGALSIAAFVVSVYVAAVGMTRFQNAGYTASLGPSIWMSLVAAVVLSLVAFTAGCGMCIGNRFGRESSQSLYGY